jgi:RNA polymerase subunit RPABC4/transcription elongation factor Spt4
VNQPQETNDQPWVVVPKNGPSRGPKPPPERPPELPAPPKPLDNRAFGEEHSSLTREGTNGSGAMFCARCGQALRNDAKFCQGCGVAVDPPRSGAQTNPGTDARSHELPSNPLGVADPMPAPGPAAWSAATATPSTAPTALHFEVDRLGRGDFVTGIATAALFVSLFLPWYSVGGYFSLNVLDVRGWMYLALLSSIAIIGYLVLRALMAELKLPIPHWQLLVAATGLNLLLTIIAFLAKPAGFSWSVGPFLALIAAIAALVGALVRRQEPERLPLTSATFASSPQAPPAPQPGSDQSAASSVTAAPRVVAPAEGTCQRCGRINPSTNRFCSTCGSALG